MAKYEPGQSGNPNGRKAGTPNKATKAAKDWLLGFLDTDTPLAEKDWQKLSERDRWQIRAKMYDYVTPKMRQTDLKIDLEAMSDGEIDLLLRRALELGENQTDNEDGQDNDSKEDSDGFSDF